MLNTQSLTKKSPDPSLYCTMSAFCSTSAFEFVFPEKISESAESLWSLITQSHLRLINLQRETEQEISHVSQQLASVRLQKKVLNCETAGSESLQTDAEHLQRNVTSEISTCFSGSKRNPQKCFVGKAAHTEQLQFREQALVALLSMLGENIQRYREESNKLDHLTEKLSNRMPGMRQLDTSMETDSKDMCSLKNTAILSNGHVSVTTNNMEDEKKNWRANMKASLTNVTNFTRSGSVKNLIHKFSTSESSGHITPNASPPQQRKDGTGNAKERDLPAVTVTPPSGESKNVTNGPKTHSHSGWLGQENGPTSPESEEEPLTPKAIHSPKYQMFLGSDPIRNGTSGPGGPTDTSTSTNGTLSKSNLSHWKSMESLTVRDFDSGPNRTVSADVPPRVFNSPYATISLDYNPVCRMSEYKMPERRSPTASEMNLFTLNRSSSPVNPINAPRARYSVYDTLSRRQVQQAPPSQFLLRNNLPSKRDYIEELTRQLDECQRRNQFLEAESIELEKERTQIRFEMRNLLVNNEDLLRMNTQLQTELKRMRDRIVELESDNNVMVERFRQIDVELKEAREVMVEANTQEYAFNFLQQSLKNKIQDAEEALEKQTQHAQELSEKLWLAERNLEETEIEREAKGKKAAELNSTVDRLETELAEALQQASQSNAELSLQQKLRVDSQLRVEELEECVLEKEQEIMRFQQIINRLQGEVTDKLMDKEQSLEDEIQLREKIQLQCKQAERAVEDLQMELNTLKQTRDDLSKQLKQTQEKVIDLETDLEEWQENEQRLITKHKRAVEQFEQMQVKLIQEKDLNDKLECEKVILERQVRELRGEMEELQNNRVQEHVITKAETRAKELENMLRMEERSKVVLNNTISKLERKINELSEQVEEEHKINNEQKDLMTQRMRSLKRQLNEAEEEASRREAQLRYTQRELAEERESSAGLHKQLLDLQLQMKRKESVMMRQTLDNYTLKLDLSDDDDEEEEQTKPAETISAQN